MYCHDFGSDLTDGRSGARIKTVTCGARYCEKAMNRDLEPLLVHRPVTWWVTGRILAEHTMITPIHRINSTENQDSKSGVNFFFSAVHLDSDVTKWLESSSKWD